MESPGKTILRYFPGLSLSGSDLTILVNCQKTLKRVKQHITAIYCTVQCGIDGLGIGTDLNGKLFAFGTNFSCCCIGFGAVSCTGTAGCRRTIVAAAACCQRTYQHCCGEQHS